MWRWRARTGRHVVVVIVVVAQMATDSRSEDNNMDNDDATTEVAAATAPSMASNVPTKTGNFGAVVASHPVNYYYAPTVRKGH